VTLVTVFAVFKDLYIYSSPIESLQKSNKLSLVSRIGIRPTSYQGLSVACG